MTALASGSSDLPRKGHGFARFVKEIPDFGARQSIAGKAAPAAAALPFRARRIACM
jgi:hypothetical protein